MPHQCLECGQLYESGSRELLKGCGSCEGTKFFYTREAVDAETRAEMAQDTDRDVRSMLKELVAARERPDYGDGIWSRDAWERWVRLERVTPDDARDELDDDVATLDDAELEVWEVAAEEAPAPNVTFQSRLETEDATDGADVRPGPDPDAADEDAPIRVEVPEPDADPLEPADPQTLRIKRPGSYELDIERLVDKAPVIVEKDGVYMVHLPSVFDAPREKGK